MIAATHEELIRNGFNEWPDEGKKTYPVLWLEDIKDGILAIARKIEEGVYGITRARDRSENFYEPEELKRIEEQGGLESVEDLISMLRDPRFIGVDRKVKKNLFKIAESPPEEDIEGILSLTFRKIRDYGGPVREKLEYMFDGAIDAHYVGRAEQFTKYNLSKSADSNSKP